MILNDVSASEGYFLDREIEEFFIFWDNNQIDHSNRNILQFNFYYDGILSFEDTNLIYAYLDGIAGIYYYDSK